MVATTSENPPAQPGRSDPMAAITARAGYMMGENVDREWTADHAPAWEGFLELSRRLRRDAEVVLDEYGDLGVSGLGILGRLARAEQRTLRQTALAEAMGLSLSRVSRLIDALEMREFVTRNPCPGDARATNVELTEAGLAVARRAQDAVYAFVQERFFDALNDAEIRTLASVFRRLLAGPGLDSGRLLISLERAAAAGVAVWLCPRRAPKASRAVGTFRATWVAGASISHF